MHSHRHHGHAHHAHGHAHAHGHRSSANRRRLLITLALTSCYLIAEVVGGLITGSLALLADAGHMFSDVAALGLSTFALRMAQRPATRRHTYGFYRTEILAALANGATLVAIAILILNEAWERFWSPPAVQGNLMMAIAAGGLLVNLVSLVILHKGTEESLNVRGAYLHVLTDALGSIGVLVAGVAIWLFRWYWADPVISVVISALVVFSSWELIRQSVAVLMEGTPHGIDVDEVNEAILGIPGVLAVHDLHVWSITSGIDALSAHVVVDSEADQYAVLGQVRRTVHDRFGIDHVTIQIEPPEFEEHRMVF